MLIEVIKNLGKGNVSEIIKALPEKKSRQWISANLNQLAEEGKLLRSKEGLKVFFVLPDKSDLLGKRISRRLTNISLKEDLIFDEIKNTTPFFKNIPENIDAILFYGFTEMLNNAIEHSQSIKIEVTIEETADKIMFDVIDMGVGVFNNIMQKKHLNSELDAINDLLKGKTTTLPHSHTGEGIFFTSKISDVFTLDSFGYRLRVDNKIQDVFVEKIKETKGTKVHFELSRESDKHLNEIFKEYESEPGSQAFDKTKVHVKLIKAGTVYISRSQARRLMTNLEKFKLVILDFAEVETVGQAFADEVFRVFANKHPETQIQAINMTETVEFMIARSKNSPN